MIRLKRDMPQYVEVENFNRYELTNNICFEMAIRNYFVKDIILVLNDYFRDDDNEAIPYDEDEDIFFKYRLLRINMKFSKFFDRNYSFDDIEDIAYDSSKIKIILKEILHEIYYLNEIEGNENWLEFYSFMPMYNNKNAFDKKTKNDDFHVVKKIENDFKSGKYDKKYKLDEENLEEQRNDYFIDFWYDYINFNKKIIWKIKNLKGFSIKDTFKNKKINKTINLHSPICKSNHIIEQNFSRPFLSTSSTNKFVTLKNINLALPEEELFEYIKLLKRQFNREKDKESDKAFISFHEVYHNEIYSTKDTINIKNKPRDKKLTAKNFRNTFNTTKKIADMLFIYDCKKINMKQADIIHELSDYYNVQKDGTLINTYYEFAKKFIDECHYKKILSGFYLLKSTKDP